jgi:hypothetical protein
MSARAALALLLLVAPVIAGCITNGPAAPPQPGSFVDSQAKLVCDPACNHQATATPATRQANELSVAVNPTNPKNVIATGKDYTPEQAGDCVWAGEYTTTDGGATWKDQNVPGSPWLAKADPTQADPQDPFSKFWCATDPVVQFGADGTAYWAVMPYQCDPVSGSKTGRGTESRGGFNDWLYTCSSMFVLTSKDGGLTWPLASARQLDFGPFISDDKEWLAVSPDGQKLTYCFDYAGQTGGGAPTPGEIPALPVQAPVDTSPNAGVVCAASKDKADTWTKPVLATNEGGFPWLDYAPDGKVWMAVVNNTDVLVLSSSDGQTWSKAMSVAHYGMPTAANEYGWPVLNGSAFRIVPYGALAIDRSGGPHDGRIYVIYFDYEHGVGNVMLTWSDDGKTWSAPVTPADAPAMDQFLPAISVGPDGTVDASWLDRRDDPGHHLYDAYYSYSLDGGLTWAKNLRVTNVSSDEKYSHHQNGMVFLGDYRDMRSARGQATMIWVDTRNQKADAFVATVTRPSANPTS